MLKKTSNLLVNNFFCLPLQTRLHRHCRDAGMSKIDKGRVTAVVHAAWHSKMNQNRE
jgi:hypothetical protein